MQALLAAVGDPAARPIVREGQPSMWTGYFLLIPNTDVRTESPSSAEQDLISRFSTLGPGIWMHPSQVVEAPTGPALPQTGERTRIAVNGSTPAELGDWGMRGLQAFSPCPLRDSYVARIERSFVWNSSRVRCIPSFGLRAIIYTNSPGPFLDSLNLQAFAQMESCDSLARIVS